MPNKFISQTLAVLVALQVTNALACPAAPTTPASAGWNVETGPVARNAGLVLEATRVTAVPAPGESAISRTAWLAQITPVTGGWCAETDREERNVDPVQEAMKETAELAPGGTRASTIGALQVCRHMVLSGTF